MSLLRYILAVLIFAWGATLSVMAEAVNPLIKQDAVMAAEAYRKGDYDTSIKKYEDILVLHLTSGNLYYNLGNCYFKKGNMAKAILNYERAKLLMPSDKNLQYNLDQAKIKSALTEDDKQSQGIALIVSAITLNSIVLWTSFLVIVLGYLLFAALFLKWPIRSRVFLSCLFVLVLIMGFLLGNQRVALETQWGIILSDGESKFEPVKDATVHFSLKAGTKVRMEEKDGDWIKIERSDEKSGWVPQVIVEKI